MIANLKLLVTVAFLAGIATAAAQNGSDQPRPPYNPMDQRPKCIAFFLDTDWRLSAKQRACDWVQNRVFSPGAAFAAGWSAGYSQITESSADRGKGTTGYSTRVAENFAQSAFGSTGAFLTAWAFREDPRRSPPFLVLRERAPRRGFWPRLAQGITNNFRAYRCVGACQTACDVKTQFAISRVAGAFASGFSSQLWSPDRLNSPSRSLRRTASAYGTSFAGSIASEFKPELNLAAGKVVGWIFGAR
jgi:hypothetical protein